MSHRFVRCPHCKMPHDAAGRLCPTTGRPMPTDLSAGARSGMSEEPPPERRPQPLGFDAARHRLPERPPARAEQASPQKRPPTGPPQPPRNIAQELIGRTVNERYLVRGVLGEGGMGMVYEADHLGLGREVAIKVLNPSQAKKHVAVRRFQQEARAAGAIGHPNICEVYDLGLLEDGSPYLVMEKLIGTTLAHRIQQEGGLPFEDIASVMIQVLSGLIAAHGKGIVHRDIKPENIFLARRAGCAPIVKILDFGVSKMMPAFQGEVEDLDLTRTGMVMGTPYYMSPEQARGERNLDGRVDVYACGVMMYEAIIGKRPFLAPNYNALLLAIISTMPRPMREIRPATPPAMEAIVTRMMTKARDDRYATANAALRDIQALSLAAPNAGRPPSAPPAAIRVPPPPTAAERKRAPVLGGRGHHVRGPQPLPRPGGLSDSDERESKTRLEKRGHEPPAAPPPDSDSIEIPVHVDELPTAVFRPGLHRRPPARAEVPPLPPPPLPPPLPAAAAGPALPLPRVPARVAPRIPARAAERARVASPAPVILPALIGEDSWDGETIVKLPEALTTTLHREPQPQPRPQRNFNPEQTVRLEGDDSLDPPVEEDTKYLQRPPRPRR